MDGHVACMLSDYFTYFYSKYLRKTDEIRNLSVENKTIGNGHL